MHEQLINSFKDGDPRILNVNSVFGCIQIQIEQDGQDAFIDISVSEAQRLIDALNKHISNL